VPAIHASLIAEVALATATAFSGKAVIGSPSENATKFKARSVMTARGGHNNYVMAMAIRGISLSRWFFGIGVGAFLPLRVI
jgi:hypothetical protein